ncbi:HAD family phosphatase [Auritidibacter ignavus]|uniref:HAD family hydrolase n=1 Tax=Auritidibacter ignavus TaxID=678932 RepID=UPI00244C3AE4|nr:HAD family phosphatase [Auritidibacter ignavus]WGH82128.1 HAD family phosphatase [Auritidibacter ignavus]
MTDTNRCDIPPRALQAVLWDMDGTLVDTEPAWNAAHAAILAEHGVEFTDELAHRLQGQTMAATAEIFSSLGVQIPAEELTRMEYERVTAQVVGHAPLTPGAADLLADLNKRAVLHAVVSASFTSLIESVLSAVPNHGFTATVGGDQVTHGKPDPEPYLTAVARLGLDRAAESGRVVVLEDSVPGILSGLSAGLPTVAVRRTGSVPLPDQITEHRLARSGKLLVVNSLTEVSYQRLQDWVAPS